MPRVLRWLLAILVVLGLAYAGFVGYVSYRSAESLLHPARDLTNATPADVGLAFERVGFTTSDGLRLAGWWVPAPDPAAARGTVVFLHGYGDSKAQSLPYLPFLHNDSLNVLAFDMRAHGESQGDHTTVGMDEVADARAAIAYAATRADPSRIALLGLSMGAATAINEAPGDARVRAIVSDSSFATLQNIASNSITHFTHLPKYPYGPVSVWMAAALVHENVARDAPIRSIASVHAPILLIQGGADDIAIAAQDGEALHRADPSSEYWLVPGAHHVEAHSVAQAEYESKVDAFLDAALA